MWKLCVCVQHERCIGAITVESSDFIQSMDGIFLEQHNELSWHTGKWKINYQLPAMQPEQCGYDYSSCQQIFFKGKSI